MSEAIELTDQDWRIRLFIYQFFVDNERPPSIQETAGQFSLSENSALEAYRRLNQRHQIFLAPETGQILMAHPLSALPTLYRVAVNGRNLWANCAWDSLGIPAMLDADVEIEARHPLSDEVIHYAVKNRELVGPPHRVHFALPARRWYDDLVHT